MTNDSSDLDVRTQTGPWAMVPAWVLQAGLTPTQLVVYVALRSFADPAGECFPKQSTLADRAGLPLGTVKNALTEMRKRGLLKSEPIHRRDGSIGGCRYWLRDVPPTDVGEKSDPSGVTTAGPGGHDTVTGGSPQRDPKNTPTQHTNEHPVGQQEEIAIDHSTKVSSAVEDRDATRHTPEIKNKNRADVERICEHLAERIRGNGSNRPTITKKWRDEARLMIDRDGRTEQQIHIAIDWCQDDPFWRSNILSVPKLRQQYDRLRLQATNEAETNNGRTAVTDRMREMIERRKAAHA